MKVLAFWLITENGAIIESGASVVNTYANIYSAAEAGAGFSAMKSDVASTVTALSHQELHVTGILPLMGEG